METWISVVINAFISLLLAVFVYGRLTQSVSEQGRRIGDLESDTGQVWKKLSDHGERLARMEARCDKSRDLECVR